MCWVEAELKDSTLYLQLTHSVIYRLLNDNSAIYNTVQVKLDFLSKPNFYPNELSECQGIKSGDTWHPNETRARAYLLPRHLHPNETRSRAYLLPIVYYQ